MTPPAGTTSYGAAAAGTGIVIWGTALETWLWGVVTLLTIAVLVVRLCVDVRAWRKRKEK